MECWADETNQKAREKNVLVKALSNLPVDGWKDFWNSYQTNQHTNGVENVDSKSGKA